MSDLFLFSVCPRLNVGVEVSYSTNVAHECMHLGELMWINGAEDFKKNRNALIDSLLFRVSTSLFSNEIVI